MHDVIVDGAYPVEAKAQTHHLHLCFGEAFDACRVADVAQYFVRESCLQGGGSLLEEVELMAAEGVESVAIASHKMGEYRAGHYG